MKIHQHLSQSSETSSEISPNDAIGVIFGAEHPGRVRGLGLGVVPSTAFRHTSTRLGGINLGKGNASTSSPNLQEKVTNLEAQLHAMFSYITTKEGGVPEELAGLFPGPAPPV